MRSRWAARRLKKAYGKGKSEPVKACQGVAPRAALIACLQPNRRVHIEIVGIQKAPAAAAPSSAQLNQGEED